MLQAFAAGDPPLLPCARRLIARAPSASVLFGHGHPGASRQRLASASLTEPVCPPRYSSCADHWPEPVIAVALSDDSQQHGRLGHGGQTGSVRDGRIGYWYTNSRFRPRGESPQRPRVSRSFIFQTWRGHEGEAWKQGGERTLSNRQPSAEMQRLGVRWLRKPANGRTRGSVVRRFNGLANARIGDCAFT